MSNEPISRSFNEYTLFNIESGSLRVPVADF